MAKTGAGHWRIMVAVFLAAVLVIGSYVSTRGVGSPSVAQASDEVELLRQLSTRDSDKDGLPDWQESLYGTNPRLTDTRSLGMSDGEAVAKGLIIPSVVSLGSSASTTASINPGVDPELPNPARGTITRALAESFMTAYAVAIQNSSTGTLSQADTERITSDVLKQLDQSIAPTPDFRTLNSLKISEGGPEALKRFAASVETVMLAYKASATSSEIVYLKQVLEDDEHQYALQRIASIAIAYGNTAVGLTALPVPPELANDYLTFINAMARLSAIITDFTRAESDPIATLIALKQYPGAVQNLGTSLIKIVTIYKQNNVTFSPGEPGALYVGIVDRIMAKQKMAETKKP